MLRFAASSLMPRVSQIAASNPLKLTNALQGAITDTMGTSGVPSTSTSWLGALCRGLKKSAQQIRAGELVQRDGRPFRVAKFHWMHGQARAAGFVLLDLVDLANGARTSEKLRLDDQVEVADVEEKGMQVLYQDEAGVHVMDSSTYEQSVLSPDLFGEGRRWVASSPELEVEVAYFQGEPVAARVPFKISVKVLDAPPAVVKADGSSTRHVVVAGGVSVMAPAHIKTGDTIVVRTEDASYMAKA